jgi:hypothetical protein
MKMLRVVAMLSLLGGLATVADAQSITVDKANRVIEVSGVGTASAEPDVAQVHVGFSTYGATLSDAYMNGSDLSSRIIQALIAAGAKKSEIQSQAQGVHSLSEYEVKNLTSQYKGSKYRASQNWTVRVEPSEVAKIIDTAVQAGANNTGQVDWLMKDSTQLEREAVSKATARATALAEEMAAGMKVRLGSLEYATTVPPPETLSGQIENEYYAKGVVANAVDVDSVKPLEIEAQRVERSVTVYAVFAIE